MIQVYKYQLTSNKQAEIVMKKGAKILTVQMQNGIPALWALVETNQENEKRNFKIYGTGQSLNESEPHIYLGTFQTSGGMYAWHLFEVPVSTIKEEMLAIA